MIEVFRHRVIKLLVERELLNKDFVRNLLSWKHSGFNIDNSVRILDESSRESLAEYIARPPISLKKIHYEPFKGRWEKMPWVAERAPEGWKVTQQHPADAEGYEPLYGNHEEVNVDARKRAWARLLAKVYEGDPMLCPKCGARMKVIAVIEDQ